jgi:hypothetical protein
VDIRLDTSLFATPLLLLSHPLVADHFYPSQSDSTTMVSSDEKKKDNIQEKAMTSSLV